MYGNYDRKMFLHSLDLNKTRGGVFSLKASKGTKERAEQAGLQLTYSQILFFVALQQVHTAYPVLSQNVTLMIQGSKTF